jgi:hypothetical protein
LTNQILGTATDNNVPKPASTAAEGGNEPDPRFQIIDDLLADVDLSMFQRRSKHAAGRTKPLTKKQRAKVKRARARIIQASKSATEDAKVLARAE